MFSQKSISCEGKAQTRRNSENLIILQSDGDESIQPSIGMYRALAARDVLCGVVREFSANDCRGSLNTFPCWDVCQCYN